MTWKRQSTSASVRAEVDLDEFDRGALLQALINDGAITEAEAEAILIRRDLKPGPVRGHRLDGDDLDLAALAMKRGDRDDALIHVERYLGREWIGRLTHG